MTTLLENLCRNGFDRNTFLTICGRKWSSFSRLNQTISIESEFPDSCLLGVIEDFPQTVNSPLRLSVPVVVAKLPNGKELGERSSRKRQFDLAKKILDTLSSGGLGGIILGGIFVFFDTPGNFRLSFVSGTPDRETREIRYNSFRRQSFYVKAGDENCRTFVERFAMSAETFSALKEIFSVEKLTKEFYAEIEKWFLRAREQVRFPGANTLGKSESEHNSDMTLRLITRLIFIWFLKAKGLVPAELFEKNKIDVLLKYNDSTGSTYYKAILQNLFFATLNTKIGERSWVCRQTGKQEFFRYKRFFKNDAKSEYLFAICSKVPFVNGGLFENLDRDDTRIDCFSNHKENEPLLAVPDELFFDGENGILPILSRFNFTVEENAPTDEDVSLDPELLGRVFENLLAFVNPETHEQARKATGAFYTPREIVQYMVNEALTAYLTEKCGAENANVIRKLVVDNEIETITADLRQNLAHTLDGLKLLDPACGSGAFPMGALTRIIEIYEMLGVVDSSNPEAVYQKKLSVIQNSLYGVDIQNIAVQISKLRFFISLLCEQKVDASKENFGISVLPNLESKIVCANTLIALPQKLDGGNAANGELSLEGETRVQTELALGDVDEIRTLRERLQTSRRNYFSASDKKEKANLRKEDEKLRRELREKMLRNAGHADAKFRKSVELVASWNPYDPNTTAPFFDPAWMFGFERADAFDIVIGNPPYIQLQKDNGALAKIYENCGYNTFSRMGDIYSLFYERGIHFLKQSAHLCFITSNKWMRAGYGEKTRAFFTQRTNPKLLVDFAGTKIFEAATVDTNVLLCCKEANAGRTRACAISDLDCLSNLSVFISRNECECRFENSDSWVILSPIEQSIKRKIEAAGTPLKDWDISINYGIKTGFNDAFIISGAKREEILANCSTEEERTKTDELIRPILRGRDIKRYSYNFADLWLINTHNGIKEKGIPPVNIEEFPAIKAHLDSFGDKLKKRTDKGNTPYNLRNCAYMEDFSKQKIVWGEISDKTKFCIDLHGKFACEATTFLMTGSNLLFLLAYLNSSLSEYLFSKIGTTTGVGTIRWKKFKLEQLFVPVNVPEKMKEEIELKVSKLVQADDADELENEIDQIFFDFFKFSEEEVSMIRQYCLNLQKAQKNNKK